MMASKTTARRTGFDEARRREQAILARSYAGPMRSVRVTMGRIFYIPVHVVMPLEPCLRLSVIRAHAEPTTDLLIPIRNTGHDATK